MNTPASQNNQSGAAMLGIVLVIIVILLALVGALAIGPQLQNITTERQTVKRANVIVDAVRQYYLARGELPDSPEASGSPTHKVPAGLLNLEQSNRYDAWGQEWCYYKASDIVGVEVSQNSGTGQKVAGLLVSSGPDQSFQTKIDDVQMSSCADFSTDRVEKGEDDIVIPINVQGEAIQIAKDELNRLSSRKICPKYSDLGISDVAEQLYSLENDWSDFLERTGLGTSQRDDPWMDNNNDQRYRWESLQEVAGSIGNGRWMSLGPDPDPDVQSLYGRTFECDYNLGMEYVHPDPPPGSPLTYIDFTASRFEDGMKGEDIASAHPAIAEAGIGASIVVDPVTGETVLSLTGNSDSWVRLNDLISDPVDFCEYTVMGWFRTNTEETDSFGPIINRETSWTNRNFWVTLWNEDFTDYDGSPIVQRASSDGAQYAFNIGVGDDENLFRDKEWHFFAVNMEASDSNIEEENGTCIISNGSDNDFTCTLFASSSACSAEDDEYDSGPDVGENVDDLPIHIGYSDTGSEARHFNGYIREIAIYSRRDGILAEGEIQNWYGRSAWMPQPVAEYRFEEEWAGTSGEVRDSVGDNDGTAENGAQTTENGVIGRAAKFEAEDSQYIDVPHSDDLEMSDNSDNNEVTVAGWIYPYEEQHVGADDVITIMSKSDKSYTLQLYYKGDYDGDPIFAIYDESFNTVIADNDPLGNDWVENWYHIVGTFDGEFVKIYVNGILQDTDEADFIDDSNVDGKPSPLYFAENFQEEGRYFNGLLDEFKIYDEALTAEEVCALYQKENACLEHDVCKR